MPDRYHGLRHVVLDGHVVNLIRVASRLQRGPGRLRDEQRPVRRYMPTEQARDADWIECVVPARRRVGGDRCNEPQRVAYLGVVDGCCALGAFGAGRKQVRPRRRVVQRGVGVHVDDACRKPRRLDLELPADEVVDGFRACVVDAARCPPRNPRRRRRNAVEVCLRECGIGAVVDRDGSHCSPLRQCARVLHLLIAE